MDSNINFKVKRCSVLLQEETRKAFGKVKRQEALILQATGWDKIHLRMLHGVGIGVGKCFLCLKIVTIYL
jgi:hypothetical protein